MHYEARQFIESECNAHPIPAECRVLEIGSYYVNGGVRDLFAHVMSYTGIDVAAGPGVDIACDCADYDGQHSYDLVISTEVLEHMPDPAALIRCAERALRPGGTLILTCAAPERMPHGAHGGELAEGEHYAGVAPHALAAMLSGSWTADIRHDPQAGDLYAVARLAEGGAVTVRSEPRRGTEGMRVLIGILAHTLDSEVVRRVHSQDWSGGDSYDVMTMWGQDQRRYETRFAAVTRKYQDLQRVFLSGPWDVLLCVEQDVLIPPHTLTRLSELIAAGADVAYGLYVWRYEGYHLWSAHPRLASDGAALRFCSLSHTPDLAREHWGGRLRVAGLGLGCTMITRQTLARLSFRQRAATHACDTALALDCQDEGLIQVADLGVVCGHRIDARRVVWPDPQSESLYRIVEG